MLGAFARKRVVRDRGMQILQRGEIQMAGSHCVAFAKHLVIRGAENNILPVNDNYRCRKTTNAVNDVTVRLHLLRCCDCRLTRQRNVHALQNCKRNPKAKLACRSEAEMRVDVNHRVLRNAKTIRATVCTETLVVAAAATQ